MYNDADDDRIKQGDVLKDLTYIDAHDPEIEYTLDFCVVLTQDCDLEQEIIGINKLEDYENSEQDQNGNKMPPTNDKYLSTILVCPAYPAESVRTGNHMASRGWKMWEIRKTDHWNAVKRNNHARYHYLEGSKDHKIPSLIIDFKHFYTLPRDYIYSAKSQKAACLETIFARSIVHRFSYYLSRVALPELK